MKTKIIIVAILGTVLLAACAPATPYETPVDVNAVRTSAAMTVVAELTLTAASWTATPLPPTATLTPEPPTATATEAFTTDPTLAALGTPAALCDNLTFDPATVDVTIPDGTQMTPGQDFVKTWKIKNNGNCVWGEGYGLIFAYGEKMSGQPAPLGAVVQIDQEIEVSINFKAPDKAGEYTSAWQMANAKGVTFGKAIFVKILVQ
jgi:hypothetical protein